MEGSGSYLEGRTQVFIDQNCGIGSKTIQRLEVIGGNFRKKLVVPTSWLDLIFKNLFKLETQDVENPHVIDNQKFFS